MDKLVYNAIKIREKSGPIANEITVKQEFRDIFTDEYSLVGNKGRMINEFRKDHKAKPKKYKGRKKYKLVF